MKRRAKASIAGLILLIGLIAGVTIAAATAPTVTTDDASAVSYTSAHASGRVDPTDQDVFGCRFDYVDDNNYQADLGGGGDGFSASSQAGCLDSGGNPIDGGNPIIAGAGETDVRADLSGLTPNTTYHLRLVADNNDGTTAVEASNTFTTLAVTAPAVTIDSVTTFDSTSAHLTGSVNPGDADPAFDSTWRFEYSTDESNWTPLADQGPISGAGAQSVADDATALQPNKRYFVRLIATNQGGQTTSDAPNPDFITEAAPPSVDTGPALFGGSAEARKLTGQVNPNNLPTSYWFEYGTADCASSSCTSVPAGQDANAGSGGTAVSVERFINALDPDTTYHYRLVARNAEGTTEGTDLIFRTPPAQGRPGDGFLPDNRAWELVSPVDKLGIDVLAESSRTHASAGATATSPSGVSFAALGGFADVQGMGLASEYLAQRTGAPGTSGWTTHGITPRQEPMTFPGVAQSLESYYDGVIAPNLSKGIFGAWSPLTDAPNVRQTLSNYYVREDLRTAGAGSYRLITDAPTLLPAPLPPLSRILRYAVAEATDNLDHILFESDAPLTAEARGNYPKLYKVDGSTTRLISVNEGCPGGDANPARGWIPSGGQCSAAGTGARALRYTPRTLSDDGRRVIFTAPVTTFGAIGNVESRAGVEGKLFQLDDRGTPSTADDAIAHVSASEKATPDISQSARYEIASVDGSRVFFMSEEQLTDTPGAGLYMWERQATDETQSVAVDATGGAFTLTFHSQLSQGSGDLTNGSATVRLTGGSFAAGQTVSGTGIPAGTTALAVESFNNRANDVRMTLSNAATASGSETLSASSSATTAALAHDATPAQVQSALESLPGIGTGNVRVTGGPGGAGGASPYQVTFTGALAGVNVAELSADGGGLTGGAGTVTVTTPRDLRNLMLIAPLSTFDTSGALGASEDGHRLYFAGDGGLVPGMPTINGRALYYWQDADGTPGGTLAFIGEVTVGDLETLLNIGAPARFPRTTRVTPDGRFLAFSVSVGNGLALRYDQQSGCLEVENPNANGLGGCSEIYVYRADSSSATVPDIVCASCPPSGAPATAGAWMMVRRSASATAGTTYLSRALSSDAGRVFFSTAEALVPQDTNGKFDAYVYDVPSGTQHLLSSGKDTADSYFLDASADGDDVYFTTREQLVGWDTDNAYDLYDARVGGGFPEPPAPTAECASSESCHSVPDASPGDAVAGSAGVVGPGNAKPNRPVRCTRSQRKVRRNGRARCVKKNKSAKKRAKDNRRAGR